MPTWSHSVRRQAVRTGSLAIWAGIAALTAACGHQGPGGGLAPALPPTTGNEHAVGYMWGTTAIGYNARALHKLAPDAPINSWRLIYDPRLLAQLARCGVSFADARPEIIATALLYVGADVNRASAQDLAAAEHALRVIRPYVGSATVNRAALPLVDAALRDDRMLYPDAEIRARLRPLHARSSEASRAEARIWTHFETARQ